MAEFDGLVIDDPEHLIECTECKQFPERAVSVVREGENFEAKGGMFNYKAPDQHIGWRLEPCGHIVEHTYYVKITPSGLIAEWVPKGEAPMKTWGDLRDEFIGPEDEVEVTRIREEQMREVEDHKASGQPTDILHVYVSDERMRYATIGPFDTEEQAQQFYEKYIQGRETESYGQLSGVFFIANMGEECLHTPSDYVEELIECGLIDEEGVASE